MDQNNHISMVYDQKEIQDALMLLENTYHKILKVNLTRDSYKEIKVYEEERLVEKGHSNKLSEWIQAFAKTGNVFQDDVEEYLKFVNIDSIKKRFLDSEYRLQFKYRRRVADSFRWVAMEMIPSVEYSESEQIVMLYIRDIHEEYAKEMNYRKELEYFCNADQLTGLWNRHYYNNYCNNYERRKIKCPVGILFADMNGLKYVNDNYGHLKGDEYIRIFAKLLKSHFDKYSCCRISGDEFIVIFEHIGQGKMKSLVNQFLVELNQNHDPMASVGYDWKECPETISELMQAAEEKMYKEKKAYHERHPERSRRE